MKIILALLTILVAPIVQAKETVTVGIASNFSELSTVSFSPFGGYFKDAIELAISNNRVFSLGSGMPRINTKLIN